MKLKKIFIVLILTLLLTYGFQELTTASLFDFDFKVAADAYIENKHNFDFSFKIVFTLFLMIFVISNNYLTGFTVITVLTLALSVINNMKINILLEPVLPQDLGVFVNLNKLMEMMTPEQVFATIGIAVAFILVTVGVIFINKKVYNFRIFDKSKLIATIRVFSLGGTLIFLLLLSHYNYESSMIKSYAQRNELYLQYNSWDQLSNYRLYGMVNGLVLNTTGENISKPDDYNEAMIDEIFEKYVWNASKVNETRWRDDFSNINVITVLSESLTAISDLEAIEINNDNLTYYRDETDKVLIGNILSPAYGGGTPNTEYELITSMSTGSLSPQVSTAFQSFTADRTELPSIFKQIQSEGRETTSLHSYNSRFYKRYATYQNFGVDQILFDKNMSHTKPYYEDGYISDEATFAEFFDIYRDSNVPRNYHIVTMQNHAPYTHVYDDTEFVIESDKLSSKEITQTVAYAEGVKESDRVLKEVITELNEIGDPYIFFVYGDHLPGLFTPLISENTAKAKYSTPFFFASNLTDAKISIPVQEDISLANTTNIIFDIAGVEISPYQALVLDVYSEFLSIHPSGYYLYGADGPVSREALTDEQIQLVDAYNAVQYDLIDGHGYAQKYLNSAH